MAIAWPLPPASADNLAPPNAAPTPYIVRAGDTLFSIATRYHTTAATLAQLNGIVNPTMIYVGQPLKSDRSHVVL